MDSLYTKKEKIHHQTIIMGDNFGDNFGVALIAIKSGIKTISREHVS